MRDLGVREIGVFRRRPNAQYHSIGPSAAPTGSVPPGRAGWWRRGCEWRTGWRAGWRAAGRPRVAEGGRRGILPCALVSGSKAEAATASRLPQSGRHERVHSDPPAASHPRTGGRRRSRRVATPLGRHDLHERLRVRQQAPACSCMITQRREGDAPRQRIECFRRWPPGLAEFQKRASTRR